ncbi:DUF1697 domain-containing protein [Rhodococcus rhodnii]|uniref:Uncharacterized protein n=2 Tax=Rhodococcus rhodnii TaxID=38312 RepID=R7WL79_9NOCA|nr:DUF1697 domain-containing protein [Rhodococcus rhodnii]EOM76057.1 hypothetical protein Rrhod_2584 [Rhodococcus rhodnii LMG 5362]TXG91457.1 DUF1697 domain-containing protein [Rhodococcus rhodnii]
MNYVALLRGVNVGGVTLRSADLRATFSATLGFGGVRPVLASGNVVFESPETDRLALAEHITDALRAGFGYDAWTLVLDLETLAGIADGYPFDLADDRQPYVVFVADAGSAAELASAPRGDVDSVAGGDGVVYWDVPKGQTLGSTFGRELARSRWKSGTTSRNLRTLRRILA